MFGAAFEHDLDAMVGGGEFTDDLWGAECAPSRANGEEDQGPAACGTGLGRALTFGSARARGFSRG